MTDAVQEAIEESADVIGEMLVDMAEDKAIYTTEEIAAAALAAGVRALLSGGPSERRLERTAEAIYRSLHDETQPAWDGLKLLETAFWRDIAAAALRASDAVLLDEVAAGRGGR